MAAIKFGSGLAQEAFSKILAYAFNADFAGQVDNLDKFV